MPASGRDRAQRHPGLPGSRERAGQGLAGRLATAAAHDRDLTAERATATALEREHDTDRADADALREHAASAESRTQHLQDELHRLRAQPAPAQSPAQHAAEPANQEPDPDDR